MSFSLINLIQFPLFTFVLLVLYWFFGKGKNVQNLILLIGSCCFYIFIDIISASYVVLYTIINFYLGKWLANSRIEKRRKRIFIFALIVNILSLFPYKLFTFFRDYYSTMNSWIGSSVNENFIEFTRS